MAAPFWDLFFSMDEFPDSQKRSGQSLVTHALVCASLALHQCEPDWFVVMCLIQHFGKSVAFLGGTTRNGTSRERQWGLVGPTYLMETSTSRSGMESALWSFSHCDIIHGALQRMTSIQQCFLPKEALFILRFQDCVEWHTEDRHTELENVTDSKFKSSIQRLVVIQANALKHPLKKQQQSRRNSENQFNKLVLKYFPLGVFTM